MTDLPSSSVGVAASESQLTYDAITAAHDFQLNDALGYEHERARFKQKVLGLASENVTKREAIVEVLKNSPQLIRELGLEAAIQTTSADGSKTNSDSVPPAIVEDIDNIVTSQETEQHNPTTNGLELETAIPGLTNHIEDDDDMDLVSGSETSLDALLLDPQLGPKEFIVPLAMTGHQASYYTEIYRDNELFISHFVEKRAQDANLLHIQKAEKLVTSLFNNLNHVDLNDPDTINEDTPDIHKANWAAKLHTKFAFLKYVLESLRESNYHIVIVSKPGHLFDITETFLRGSRFIYATSRSNGGQNPLVTLLSADEPAPLLSIRPADLVISLDPTYRRHHPHDDLIRKVRRTDSAGMPQVPIIQLIVAHTIEHVYWSLSSTATAIQRLLVLFSAGTQLLPVLKDVDLAMPIASDAGAELLSTMAQAIQAGRPLDYGPYWTLPTLPALDQFIAIEEITSESSNSAPNSQGTTTPVTASRKRALASHNKEASKRIRMTPQEALQQDLGGLDSGHLIVSGQTPQQPTLSVEEQLHKELKEKDKVIAELRKRQHDEYLQSQKDMDALQNRFEEQYKQTRLQKKELADQQAKIDYYKQQEDRHRDLIKQKNNEIRERKAAYAELEKEVKAQSPLDSITIASWKVEKAEMEATIEAAEKKVKSKDVDYEYLRNQYQERDHQLNQFTTRNTELEVENKKLAVLADQNQVTIKKMHNEDVLKTFQNDVDDLKWQLEYSQKQNTRLQEQLIDAQKPKGMTTSTLR